MRYNEIILFLNCILDDGRYFYFPLTVGVFLLHCEHVVMFPPHGQEGSHQPKQLSSSSSSSSPATCTTKLGSLVS